MKKIFTRLRSFSLKFGLVEQAQIVASTAVVVIMVTIITATVLLQKKISYLDFIVITTVGIIGYTSVYFSLKYGRQLEEQRLELDALNTVAQVVTKSINLIYIFSNVLQTVTNILKTKYGWLYILDGDRLTLKNSYGTNEGFFSENMVGNKAFQDWTKKIRTNKETKNTDGMAFLTNTQLLDIASWVSVPLTVSNKNEGVLLLASSSKDFFPERKVNLISAFSNQISVALNNAHLFDKLRQSEERYMDLFENSPDMYHLVNHEGIIINCNQTESEVLGYEKTEIVGKPMAHLYSEDMRQQVNQIIKDAFEYQHEIRSSEEQMLKKDGTLIDVSVNTSLVYDETKTPVLMRCVVRDITDKKMLEQKIMQAQKIDSIGNLAGGIAHDFNNILTSIMGASSIMRRRMMSRNKLYPFVDIIETASTRGKSLTNQLLTFARRTPVEFHSINVVDVLEETLRIFEPSVKPLVDVVRNYSLHAAIINGDEGQIQQALLNLFINARDAMPNGGKLIVDMIIDHKNEQSVSVRISDNGIGMTKEVQQQIFVPFFSTKEQGKGTGLGLSVVYGVMKSHNGTVSFNSELDKGTSFVLTFPLNNDVPQELISTPSKKMRGGTESVLIVDDEEFVRITLSTMLIHLGYKVTIAESGKEAISLVSDKRKFDLVVLDMNMPQIGGKKVFQKIKALKLTTKIIVSSGYSDDILGKDNFVTEVEGFLQKPYKIEELAKKIRDVLDAA
ncbi:MAG: PAS domain S-box protein [Bacteroidota bacterium]|nr:PAS domain S-box protein [Bacteroidota bacterium]